MPKKEIVGVVVSDKLQKTITVLVTRLKEHRRYKKYVRTRKKYLVHDESEEAKVGDVVVIEEFRPISKRKRFVLKKVITRGVGPDVELAPEAGVEELSRLMREKELEEKKKKEQQADAETTAGVDTESLPGAGGTGAEPEAQSAEITRPQSGAPTLETQEDTSAGLPTDESLPKEEER